LLYRDNCLAGYLYKEFDGQKENYLTGSIF
jgi:hypothetical protein